MNTIEVGEAEIPSLGFGTFQLSGDRCRSAVKTALESGYRHVDTAEYYENEAAVGAAIRDSNVDREDIFLTTKVWRSNLRHDDVIDAAEASLDRLGVEYADLLLAHWPHPRAPVEETLGAMDGLCERGLIRHIGVSNFTQAQLSEAESVAQSDIVTDQVLYHPFADQRDLLSYCADSDTALTAYSPLARGAVLGDSTLERIGDIHGKAETQVALRWLLQQENVVAIPRSSSPEHIRENADIFDFELTDEEMGEIDDLRGSLRTRLANKLPALMRSFPL